MKLKVNIIVLIGITGVLSGITAGGFLALTRDLPQIQELENFKPSAATLIYSSDQKLIGELYIEKRTPVRIEQIPKDLITALLTTEDRRFYQHSGIVIRAILRATVRNLIRGRYAEGASTLTQQLAKTLFLTPRKTLLRKMREAVLAIQLERRYTKNEILELYLNQIYFGSGTYGVSSAARLYFDKSIHELNLSESAMIAGLPKRPSRYSPLVNMKAATDRRNIVLKQMLNIGDIDKQTYENAIKDAIALHQNTSNTQSAPHFISYIKDKLETAVGPGLMYKGGLTVHTTLSHQFQTAATSAVENGLAQIEERMKHDPSTKTSLEAALVAIQIQTGEIISMIGGRDQSKINFNRAVTAIRQPGSAFKPIVYAAAIEHGFAQTHKLLDSPIVFQRKDQDTDWRPENFSNTYDGEVTMRWALVHSKNIPAVRLIEKLGPSAVIHFAQALGLSSELNSDLSLSLGTSNVRLIELTAAYSVFANHGKYIRPYGIIEVRNDEGRVIWREKRHQRIAMSRTGAAIITDMLEGVIKEGTGRKAQALPGPLAGKTGTTNDFKDAIFIGYSPNIAAGVWVGNDNATSLGQGETGARAALPIWIAYMRTVLESRSQQYFDIPDDLRKEYVHPRSGASASADTPGVVRVLLRKTISSTR